MRLALVAVFAAGCAGTSSSGGDDVAVEIDAAPTAVDAKPPDTRPYSSTPANCDDAPADLYVTPASIPAARGAIVRCVLGPELDPAAAEAPPKRTAPRSSRRPASAS